MPRVVRKAVPSPFRAACAHFRALIAQDASVQELPEIQEGHIIAGDFDYILKVRCADGEALALLLRDRIRTLPGVAATSSRGVLATAKETTAVSLS